MPELIGEALVAIRPDLRGLRFQVQTGVAQALRGIELGALTGATAGLTGATAALATSQLGLAGSAVTAADAEGTLSLALRVAGVRAGEAAAANVLLATSQLELAATSRSVAVIGSTVAASAKRGSAGLSTLANDSNIARGALIGLARVTPVAVFGLGVAGTAAIAAAVGFREAISLSAQFEKQLNVFAIVSEATAAQMQEVSATAKELGRDITLPGVSAGDSAAAMTELAKAGLTVRDAVDSARGVLQLGTAAQIDFGSAAQIVASALNAFDLPGTRAAEVADLLAAASISAQGEITDMAAALAQSAAVAKQANIPIEDTVTAISLLAKSGLLGSDAGTSLRTTILRLVPTTKEAAQFTRALGIEFEDAEGRLRPLPEIFDQYRVALAKLPPVLQQAALQQIFGQDAIRAASILAREGAVGFAAMAEEVTREGVAADVAGAQTAGFSGQVSQLGSNLESLGVTLGTIVLPGLGALVEGLGLVTGALDKAIEASVGFIDKEAQLKAPDLLDVEGLRDQLNKVILDPSLIAKLDEVFRPRRFVAGAPAGEDLKKLGEQLRLTQLDAGQLAEVFKDSSSDIGKALRDGVIGPLEAVRLQSTQAGRDFLAGFAVGPLAERVRAIEAVKKALADIPPQQREVTAGFQAATREQGKFAAAATTFAVKPTAFAAAAQSARDAVREALDQIPTEKQVNIVLNARNFEEGIKEVVRQARGLEQPLEDSFGRAAARAGEEGGRKAGKGFTKGFADAISESEAEAIRAARRAVRDAQEAAEEQVREAVFAAKDSLSSLGADLNSQLATLIDTGPVALRIARLQEQLDRLTQSNELSQLREGQRSAREALREAQRSIATVGPVSADTRRAQQEFLAPFKQRVKDANAAVKEFDLTKTIDQLKDAQEAAKKAAEIGLDNLIQRFKDGKISAGEFQKLLSNQLSPALKTLSDKAGKNLGLSFTSEFFENVKNLRDQVRELVGFLGITGPSPNVVRPGEVQTDAQRRVDDARANLASTIENARKTAEATGDSSDTLVRIERILRAQTPVSPGGRKITAGEAEGFAP